MANPSLITDPQSQSTQSSANVPSVDNSPVGGDNDNTRVLSRQTPSGTSRGIQQLGSDSLTADSGNKRIIVSDGVNRVLMGNQPTFGEGFYVSKPGIDVVTTTSPSDFIFNSGQNVFKIVLKGSGNISGTSLSQSAVGYYSGVQTFEINHNLGYQPAVIAYVNYGSTDQPVPDYREVTSSSSFAQHDNVRVFVDETTIYLQCRTELIIYVAGAQSTSVISYPITYYLLQETAN